MVIGSASAIRFFGACCLIQSGTKKNGFIRDGQLTPDRHEFHQLLHFYA
jgi:hypothetical protein